MHTMASELFMDSQAAGEEAVRKAFPTATIMKPAVLVGTEDRMFNSWATLAMNLPYLPLTGGDSQVQVCRTAPHTI